jgi:hypothetical protein
MLPRLPSRILALLAFALWMSATILFVLGSSGNGSLAVLRLVAIPDALFATLLTWIVIRRWTER